MRSLLVLALLSFTLAFLSAASAIAGGVPQGSYLQSCEAASVSGDVLTADCKYGGIQAPSFRRGRPWLRA